MNELLSHTVVQHLLSIITNPELFYNHTADYFTSIQGKNWYWPLFVNAFEISLVSSWKLNQLFSDDSLSLVDFQIHIKVAYLGLSIPRKVSGRKLGVRQVNEDFLKINNEHVIVNKTENRQRRFQLKTLQQNQQLFVKNVTLDYA